MEKTPKLGNGYIAKNGKKEKETHPDYLGKMTIEGTKYDMAGYIKKNEEGQTYISFSVTAPWVKSEQKPKERAMAKAMQAIEESEDSSIPF